MNKILSALLVGLFAVSVNTFAADAAVKAEVVKTEIATPVAVEKHAAAPAKKAKHLAKKADKALKVAEVKTEATAATK